MTDSILNSVKKALGIAADYTDFDLDIIMLINSTFSTLEQLGIGPAGGYTIDDAADTWSDFIEGDPRFNSVKTLTYLKVRLIFDPPTVSHAQAAMKEQISELEWRLNVTRENDRAASLITEDVVVLDGGDA